MCRVVLAVAGTWAALSCGGTAMRRGTSAARTDSCPALVAAPDLPPGTTAEQRTLAYWTATLRSQVDLDVPLLDTAARARLDETLSHDPHAFDLAGPLDPDDVTERVDERREDLLEAASTHTLFEADGTPVEPARFAAWERGSVDGTLHVASRGFEVRCTPSRSPYFRSATDHRFDRNQCSHVEAGEPVQIVARLSDGTLLVRTRYTFGYTNDPPFGEVVPAERAASIVQRARVRRSDFTRRAVLEEAFAHMGRAYGWGGQDGGLDCSAFVLDVLGAFGVHVPRHSADQADAGSFRIDVPEGASREQRLSLLDEANRSGLVLVHFPGHVMLHLGRDESGAPMAIHAYAEYVEPCTTPANGRTETVRTTHGVDVTTYELGLHTSRRSYLERMTSLTVFGNAPTAALTRMSGARKSKVADGVACTTEDFASLHRSPRRPHVGAPMRMLFTSEEDPGDAGITMVRADGRRVELEVERVEGPPFGLVGRWPRAEEGVWTVFVGSGSNVLGCEPITVAPTRERYIRPVTSAPHPWDRAYEDLWSLFVTKLFDYPYDDRTWPNLQVLLRDPERNILFDHFTAEEEARLRLEPDCADLPYLLRAYFSWKMGMPFAVRPCSGGRSGGPPTCSAPLSNVGWLDAQDRPLEDFQQFANLVVRQTAHSASARTSPRTDASDFYPIDLTRDAIRPGTIYADPYGHVMLVSRFIPQTSTSYGMLTAADAQPDATIGRPRFWRGTFLFTPDTRLAGAGFKAFRPARRRGEGVSEATNEELRNTSEFARYSMAQYEGTADDFYDRVEAIIDPNPVDAGARLVALVDALHDSVRRRTVSVDNAERWVTEHRGQTIPMPTGAEIFQTSGAWEDYSTPSRDLRLLIAIDTVVGFPAAVERRPARFGVSAADVPRVVAELRATLDRVLAERTFQYRGSRGDLVTLSLADVRARARNFEVAYDPNDCPEVRWGAGPGMPEFAACGRRAPEGQARRLAEYRVWFAERRRPPP